MSPRLLYTPSHALLDRRASTQIHTTLQVSVGWAATTPSCRRHTSPRALGTRYEHCGCVRWDGSPSWAGPHLLRLPIVTSHNMCAPVSPFLPCAPVPPFPSSHSPPHTPPRKRWVRQNNNMARCKAPQPGAMTTAEGGGGGGGSEGAAAKGGEATAVEGAVSTAGPLSVMGAKAVVGGPLSAEEIRQVGGEGGAEGGVRQVRGGRMCVWGGEGGGTSQ